MTDRADQFRKLVADIVDAQNTYTSLRFDEATSGTPRAPATPEQIAGLERAFGRALPSSLKAFLSVHNGFANFHADGVLLGTEDHDKAWVAKRVSNFDRNWADVEPNPFSNGALPLMIGPDIQHFVVVSGDRVNDDGEPLLVEYDLSAEVRSFPNVETLLGSELEALEAMIDRQRQGEAL